MKQKTASLSILVFFLLGLISFQSCKEESNEPANQPPTIFISNPSEGEEIIQGEPVIISAEAEDEDGNLKEVRFYIDDIGAGLSESQPHNYEWETAKVSEGKHIIKVVALDEEQARSEEEMEVILINTNQKPVAAFSADTTQAIEGTTIHFTDESIGEPAEWEWHFGDGNTSTKQNTTHTYSMAGDYTVVLTVSNAEGIDTETKTNYITIEVPGEAPIAAFKANQTSVEIEEAIEFVDQSSENSVSWSWDFGDGATSDQQNPSHVYNSLGYYTVKLTVENEFGADTETKSNYIKVSIENSGPIDLDWSNVAGGTFQMGSYSGTLQEIPVHAVTLSSFEITKYEISNEYFAEFLNDIGCNSDGSFIDMEYGLVKYIDFGYYDLQIEYSEGQFTVENGKENYPIYAVTWYGANAFAHWAEGRLPTEAEWEFAARGGNESQHYNYSGSNNIDEVAWYGSNSDEHSHEVGQKLPNELGIYDMSGNMYEWCNDWYDTHYYAVSVENNPQGPDSGTYRVVRSGSWYLDTPFQCRVSARGFRTPGEYSFNCGFRIVR